MTQQLLNSEEIITELDISHLVIEDDTEACRDELKESLEERIFWDCS